MVCFVFYIQFTSTVSPGCWEGGWTRPDLAVFAPCAPEPTGKICAVGGCCWDWVGGAGSQQEALGGCSLALIKLGRRWKAKGKRQPACWPEGPRAEDYLLKEPGCPSCPGQVSPGMIQPCVGCSIASFIPLVGFAWGRSRCQAVLSSDASPLSLHWFPRRSPELQGSDWSLQTPEPVSQQMAFPLSWKPWLNFMPNFMQTAYCPFAAASVGPAHIAHRLCVPWLSYLGFIYAKAQKRSLLPPAFPVKWMCSEPGNLSTCLHEATLRAMSPWGFHPISVMPQIICKICPLVFSLLTEIGSKD